MVWCMVEAHRSLPRKERTNLSSQHRAAERRCLHECSSPSSPPPRILFCNGNITICTMCSLSSVHVSSVKVDSVGVMCKLTHSIKHHIHPEHSDGPTRVRDQSSVFMHSVALAMFYSTCAKHHSFISEVERHDDEIVTFDHDYACSVTMARRAS